MTTTTATAKHRVVWVGGPPGKTFQKIVDKLAADGIEVGERQETFSCVPTWATAVLACMDMLGHSDFDASKAEAKSRGVPWVATRLDYSRTRSALVSAGLVAPDVPAAVEVAEAVERLEAGALDSAEAIEALLQKLPLNLVRVAHAAARQKIEDAEREERVQMTAAAVEAFHMLAAVRNSEDAYSEFVSGLDATEVMALSRALRKAQAG